MSLDARFHDCDPSIKFDGANFEDFQFALFTASQPVRLRPPSSQAT